MNFNTVCAIFLSALDNTWEDVLSDINVNLRHLAHEAIKKKNAIRLLGLMDNENCLSFVFQSHDLLKKAGFYERALIDAIATTRTNNCWCPPILLEEFLKIGDRNKLREAGDRLPKQNNYVVYRGVRGSKGHRHVRGLSWTGRLDVACWFATRYDKLSDPAIYKTKVTDTQVYCYINDRQEQEFICRPRFYKRLTISYDEMLKRAEIIKRETKQQLKELTIDASGQIRPRATTIKQP